MSEWGHASSIVFTELEHSMVVTCPSALTPKIMSELQSKTLDLCSQKFFRAVILDLSAVPIIDLVEWKGLLGLSAAIKLMGGSIWFVGLKPSVVESLILMNAQIEGVQYAMGVQDALELQR